MTMDGRDAKQNEQIMKDFIKDFYHLLKKGLPESFFS
jgi:hypothetical protein